MGGYAWVTLATNDAYSLGALVLAHSLRRVGTKYELAVLVTPGVTNMMREKLAAVFSLVQEVNVLDSKDEANLALLARPELGITFTKLHCWRLTQYEKCVFVDADTLVVRNCDELFEREELSAAPDVGWPDCFNSGVFVFKPSQQTFASITAFAAAKGSFDGGDQGLLNMYFNDWARKDISKHLPFIYNMCSTATYSYLPAFKQFGEDVRIIHFIGITKPWLQYFDTLTGIVQPPSGSPHLQPLLQLWWNIFCDKVHPQLSPAMAGLAGALAQMTLGEPRSAEQIALEEHMRKQSWEQGQIDYMGRDSFDNIWKKICETLSLAPPRQPSPPKTTSEDEAKSEKTENVEVAKAASTDLPVQSKANDDVDSPTAKTTTELSETQSLICKIPKDDVSLQETYVKHDSSSSTQSTDTPQSHTKDESVNVNVQSSFINEKTVQLDTLDLKAVSADMDSKQESSQLESKTIYQADAGLSIAQTTNQISMETTTDLPSVGQSFDQTMILNKPVLTDIKQDIDTKKELGKEVMREKEENVKMPVDVIQESNTGKDTELSSVSVSEVMFTNPVPIQVAESVLQTEPKESVTQEAKLITEEVITSTVAPVQEAVVASSETLVELTDRTELCDPTLLISSNESANVMEPSTTPSVSQNGGTVVNGSTIKLSESDLLAQFEVKNIAEERQSPQEAIQSQKTEMLSEQSKLTESSSIAQEQAIETVEINKDIENLGTTSELKTVKLEEAQEVKEEKRPDTTLDVQSELKKEKIEEAQEVKEEKVPDTALEVQSELKTVKLEEAQEVKEEKRPDTTLDVQSELKKEKVEEAQEVKETTALLDTSKPSLESESTESPVRPTRTKELTIPSTPTVTEPTPPTSPITLSTQDVENQGKTVKKTVKKVVKKTLPSDSDSAERADTEGTEKKTAKKVVKKVVKKPKEGQDEVGESSSSTDKPKKTAKGTKKITKPSQSLETDTSIPETPPPGSSDAPVPPKRKVKASTSTKPASTASKPDTES